MTATAPSERPDVFILQCGAEVVLRDLTPGDEELYPDFHARVSVRDRRLRFFSAAPIGPRQVRRLTRFDAGEAVVRAGVGVRNGELYGVARLHRIADGLGEFAVMVRSDLKAQGLGRRLLEEVLDRAPAIGVSRVMGLIMAENAGMIALAGELGFELHPEPAEPGVLRASLDLAAPSSLAA